jgi:ketopantoate hydroxymethyltransferase
MGSPLPRKFTLNDPAGRARQRREGPMLTCYDFTTARLMHEAGVPAILVWGLGGNVISGTTRPSRCRCSS